MSRIKRNSVYRGLIWSGLLLLLLAANTAAGAASPEKQEARRILEEALQQAKQSGRAVTVDVETEDPAAVQEGDLVLVNYTVSLEDGSLVYTTMAEAADDTTRKKSEGYRQREWFGPEEMVAGQPGFIPAVGGLVMGLQPGEKQTFTLRPEDAFGPRDLAKTAQYPCERRMLRYPLLNPQTFVNQFNKFPVVGREVDLTPYFKSRIVEVTENHVKLESLARGGERSEDPIGTIEVGIDGNEIVLRLTPRLGADFEMNDQKGRIVSTDGTTFTVDFNPPLAGQSLVVDLEVVSLTKASAFKGLDLGWIEDHDEALDKADRDNKPMVLLLYADWCNWSQKLLDESFVDPRIKAMKDRFVWARANSATQKDLYHFYEQNAYPLVVVLSPEGEIIQKIDGYREAGALKRELEEALAPRLVKGR